MHNPGSRFGPSEQVRAHSSRDLERRILKAYYSSQYEVLRSRHSDDDCYIVRTLSSFHQQAAQEAKEGRLHVATVQLDTLDGLQPMATELRLCYAISVEPVRALIKWKASLYRDAIDRLLIALDAGDVLATKYQHTYLTARRLYLASHIARVHLSTGMWDAAQGLVANLWAVKHGSTISWPFGDSASLSVPLDGDEDLMLTGHLITLQSLLNELRPTAHEHAHD
jgi:hypothetical protein